MKKIFLLTIILILSFLPFANAKAGEEENFKGEIVLRIGSKKGLGYLWSIEGKKGKEFYSLAFDQMYRDGHYPLEKNFSSSFFLEYHWVGGKNADWSIVFANDTTKEQDRTTVLFLWPQQKNLQKDDLSLNWIKKQGKEESKWSFFWNREKKQKISDWWPDFFPESSQIFWADYGNKLNVWGIERKRSYPGEKGITWREKGKLSREELSYRVTDLNSGKTLQKRDNTGLYQASYFWEREEKRKDTVLTLGAGLDYNSECSVYSHWEAKGKKGILTLSWKEYSSLPSAKKLWDMDSVLYLNSSKKYSLYKSWADLKPEKRREVALEIVPVSNKSSNLSLKFYKWRLENYIAYQRESYSTVLFRQYGNYPLVNWQGADINLKKN